MAANSNLHTEESEDKTHMNKMQKDTKIIIVLIAALVVVIGALIYFNNNPVENNSENTSINTTATATSTNNITVQETTIKRHVPVNLSEGDVLVSFRIDDITFEKKDKIVLENALYLARKYNVTFDLAVIAKPFDEKADPEVYRIYLDNQDVFEVVAHGYTHVNPINSSRGGEFYDSAINQSIPSEIQEEHIRHMYDIFSKYDLFMATKILVLPWHAGDLNTSLIAENYGYKVVVQSTIQNNQSYFDDGETLTTREYLGIAMVKQLDSKMITRINNAFIKSLMSNQSRIHIMTHPINYQDITSMETITTNILNISNSNSRIKYDFISATLSLPKKDINS